MGLEELRVTGETFDPAAVPDGTERLAIDGVVKKTLPRMAGLERLPLKALELRRVSAPDFTVFPLPPILEELEIWQCRGFKRLDGIDRAPRLRKLRLWWTAPLEDLTALAKLRHLRVLQIEGGLNDKQKLASLDFLRGLALEELVLSGIGPKELDIEPIFELDGLKRFLAFGPDFEPDKMARLAARFPALHADLTTLQDYPEGMGQACKSCGGGRKMLMLRGRKFLWCPVCDADALDKTLAGFDAMVEAARQDGVEALSGVELARE